MIKKYIVILCLLFTITIPAFAQNSETNSTLRIYMGHRYQGQLMAFPEGANIHLTVGDTHYQSPAHIWVGHDASYVDLPRSEILQPLTEASVRYMSGGEAFWQCEATDLPVYLQGQYVYVNFDCKMVG